MVFNAPHLESTLKKLRERGGGSAACLDISQWDCFPMLDSHFTHFSVTIGHAGLGDIFDFQGKEPYIPVLRSRSGFKAPLSLVRSIRWKSARKEGADCFASYLCHYGATVAGKVYKAYSSLGLPTSCWPSLVLSAAPQVPGLNLCPGKLPVGDVLVFVGFHLKFSDKYSGGYSRVWAPKC